MYLQNISLNISLVNLNKISLKLQKYLYKLTTYKISTIYNLYTKTHLVLAKHRTEPAIEVDMVIRVDFVSPLYNLCMKGYLFSNRNC